MMTVRNQKMLVIVLAVAIGAFILYVAVDSLWFSRVKELDDDAARLDKDIKQAEAANKVEAEHLRRLKGWSSRMIQANESQASGMLASTVSRLLADSHMDGQLQAAQPDAKSVGSNYKEIGQTIHIQGKLEHIIDFLYLLEAQPFLHRTDNLTVARNISSGSADVTFHYSVLIPDYKKKPVIGQPTTAVGAAENLDASQRRQYDVIASRDLQRPYVKRIVEVAATPAPTTQPPRGPEPTKQPPRPREFSVCGLSTWSGGEQDIVLRDTQNNEVRHFKPGEKLPNGAEAVMIDYRRIPAPDSRPDAPKPDSSSRLIMKIGQEYWSVDIERNLSDKRPVKAEQLPPELRATPATSPVEVAGKADGAGK
jgi:hypothetical protein